MADDSPKKKRKREDALEAMITYHTPLKTFERRFQETSLEDTRRVVRRKLGLADNAKVQLAQMRGNNIIVLEDDDDFQALCITLKANPLVDVQVTLSDANSAGIKDNEVEDAPAIKKRKVKRKEERQAGVTAEDSSEQTLNSPIVGPPSTDVSTSMSSHLASISETKSLTSGSKQPSPAFFSLFPPLDSLVGTAGLLAGTIGTDTKAAKAVQKVEKGTKTKDKEKKERPKKPKKTEPTNTAALSPAAREKAAAVLQHHRDSLAEKAKQPRKRTKKEEKQKEVKEQERQANDAATSDAKDKDSDAEPEEAAVKSESAKKKKKKSEAEKEPSPTKNSEESAAADKGKSTDNNSSPVKAKKKGGKEDSKVQTPARGKATKDKSSKTPKGNDMSVQEEETHKTSAIASRAASKPFVLPLAKKSVVDSNVKTTTKDGRDSLFTDVESHTSKRKKKDDPVLCPICLQPHHLRFKCPLLTKGGKPLQDRLKVLKRSGKNKTVIKDIEDYWNNEKKREMLQVLHGRKTLSGDLERDIWGGPSELSSDAEDDVVMEDKGQEEEDVVSLHSMPESVTRSEQGPKNSVRVQKPGEGSDSVSSDDEEPAVDRSDRSESGDGSEDSERRTALRGSRPHPPTSPSSLATTGGRVTRQYSPQMAKTLVRSSSTERSSDENTEQGEDDEDKMDGLQDEVGNDTTQDAIEVGSVHSRFRQASPTRLGRNLQSPSRMQSTTDKHTFTPKPSDRTAGDSDSDSEPIPLVPSSHDLASKLVSTPQSQEPPRGSFLPRLSGLTNMASSLFRTGGKSASQPLPQPLSTPARLQMPTPNSVPRPITVPRDNHDKIVADSSSSESESSSEDQDQPPRIPKNQRASSRIAMQPRRSVLSLLP